MNKDIAEAQWKQMKGKLREQWGKLTDDDLEQIKGRRDLWSGKMQERYGMGRDEAEREFERLHH